MLANIEVALTILKIEVPYISIEDLDKIVLSYDVILFEAPVINDTYNYNNDPDLPFCVGAVQHLTRKNNCLITSVRSPYPSQIKPGKDFSVSFYSPKAQNNPAPESWYLKQINLRDFFQVPVNYLTNAFFYNRFQTFQ